MQHTEAPLAEWSELYKAAEEFRDLSPWSYMADTDLFAVVWPENGRTGYCSVFGAGGEIFGLAVFLGTRGFRSFQLQASSQDLDFSQVDDTDLMERLPYALMATFEDESDLEPRDKEQITRLGLDYHGTKAWPLFRLHEPGYAPWYVDPEDVPFLAFVLREARSLASRIRENPNLLEPNDASRPIFTRRQVDGEMVDAWTEEPFEETRRYPLPDLAALKNRIRFQKPRHTTATWEVDYFYLPRMLVREESGRPAFPRVVMCVDKATGRVLDTHAAIGDGFYREAPVRVLEAMLRRGVPRKILVQRLDVLATLAPVAELAGAKLGAVEQLDLLDGLKRDLVADISDRYSPEG